MKKTLLFIGATALFSFNTKAQITVTDANLVSIGDQIVQTNDTTVSGTPTAAGPSQTWNMASLLDHERDTTDCVDPSTTTNGALFPSANIAFVSGGGNATYVNKTTSSLKLVGAEIFGTPANMDQTLINFPSTYNSTFTAPVTGFGQTTGAAVGQPSIDSVRLTRTGTMHSHIDAYGSLTTPLGVFDVLRQNDTIYTIDTIDAKYFGSWNFYTATVDTVYSHQFLSDDVNAKYPLLSYNLDAAGNYETSTVTWLYATPAPASINEISNSKLSLYPNPANDIINIDIESVVENVVITDLAGKTVYTANKTINNTVNVSKLDAGTYVINVYSANRTYSTKFIKR